MEASLLRGILLFNSKEKRVNRDEMMQKALFSIILLGEGKYTDEQIVSIFDKRFNVKLESDTLIRMKKKLQDEKLVDSQGVPIEKEKGQNFFEAIENETEALYEGIIKKVEKSLCTTITNRDVLKGNIRNALSV